ncbi:MAG TPA: zinc metallopeptidase [Candidatus Polarisedimenticolia bacterium]|nr:zinc metallopeptidase [Candidatus Polarisedimenticolia bacterium]
MIGFFDPLWLVFAIPGLLLGIYAQAKLSGTYNKYMRVGIQSGLTGAQAAREILNSAGLNNVPVVEVPGRLTDHYDPRKRALFLSAENFERNSLSSVGVAAHEAGHALQHQASYAPLNLRMAMVPITNFASRAYSIIFALGFAMMYFTRSSGALFHNLIWVAVALFSVVTLFQIITLPVEFDASRRAKEQLFRLGIVHANENAAISKVLNSAALTYVAAMISAVFQLLYLITAARDRR